MINSSKDWDLGVNSQPILQRKANCVNSTKTRPYDSRINKQQHSPRNQFSAEDYKARIHDQGFFDH